MRRTHAWSAVCATVNAIPDRCEVWEPGMSESSRGPVLVVWSVRYAWTVCGCMLASSWYGLHVSGVVESCVMKIHINV